jgi:hypothetical protein
MSYLKILIITLLLTSHSKLIAQCDGIPTTYNLIKKESKWIQLKDLNFYVPIIQYIGYPKDSIYLGVNSTINEQLVNHKIDKKFRNSTRIKRLSEANFSIQVCNLNIIKMSFGVLEFKPFEPNILNCYSIIIKNLDIFPIDISIGKIVPLVIEAEEHEGKWKTIIEEYQYGCTTGDFHYFIKPKEIAIVAVPIIPINRKYRYRIAKTNSNIFYQKLNLN